MTRLPNTPPDEPKRILIVATTHWVSTSRLAMSLTEFGCRVELMAPAGHPALGTDAVNAHHTYRPMFPLEGCDGPWLRAGRLCCCWPMN